MPLHDATSRFLPAPSIGQLVSQDETDLLVLAANPDRPGTWHVLNRATGELDLITTPTPSEAAQPVDLSAFGESVRNALASLIKRAETAEKLSSSSQRTIEQIRAYAIERHEDGDICESGLRAFLEFFNLDPYAGTVELSITMHGSARINAADVDTAIARVRYLVDGFAHSGETTTDDFEIELGSIGIEPRER